MLNSRIVFRADGNSNIGLGHVSRCLALYDILKGTYKEAIFVTRDSDIKTIQTIESKCATYLIQDSLNEEEELNILCNNLLQPDDYLVLDGYHFKTNFQKVIKQFVAKLIVVDDEANWHIVANMVINHGGSTIAKRYSVEAYTKLLLGFSFCLLRKEFLDAARVNNTKKELSSLVICMGGADSPNNSLKFLRAIVKLNLFKNISVITGSAYKYSLNLTQFIELNPQIQVAHLQNLNPEQMVDIIRISGVCIASASTIALEIASVHCGLIIGITANNQIALHNSLVETGCAVTLNNINDINEEQIGYSIREFVEPVTISAILKNQELHFDGRSAERVIDAINSI
jgi:UDP-2,4-diacetamido-2,4,6-trideoxy-beta-L-altropyranose hydrolase